MSRLLAVAALLLLFLLGLTLSTELVARSLHDAPVLGPPWAHVGTTALYAPWAWVAWSGHFARYAPDAFRTASALTTGSALLGLPPSEWAGMRAEPVPPPASPAIDAEASDAAMAPSASTGALRVTPSQHAAAAGDRSSRSP